VPPFDPPVPLALCRSVDHVLGHPHTAAIEPNFDGWRCQVLAGAGRLWSRHGTDLSASFADIAEASRALPDCVLDGELVAVLDSGELAFGRLQSRSGRGPRSHGGFTVHLAAFDVLAVGDTDWRPKLYSERRGRLLDLLEGGPPVIRPVPVTGSVATALDRVGPLGGVEGIVMKPGDVEPDSARRDAGATRRWIRRLCERNMPPPGIHRAGAWHGRTTSRSAIIDGYRVAVASAARMASSPTGWPFSFEYGPYGVPHTGVPVACRQLSASVPASTTL
jgi:ATP-dependent DNA ligase